MKDLEQIIKEVTLEIAMAGTDNPEQVSSDNRKKIMREIAVRYATQQVEKFNSKANIEDTQHYKVTKEFGIELTEPTKAITFNFSLSLPDSFQAIEDHVTVLVPEKYSDKRIDSVVEEHFELWLEGMIIKKWELVNVQ